MSTHKHVGRIIKQTHPSKEKGAEYVTYEAACSCGWLKRLAWHTESAARADMEDHVKATEGR